MTLIIKWLQSLLWAAPAPGPWPVQVIPCKRLYTTEVMYARMEDLDTGSWCWSKLWVKPFVYKGHPWPAVRRQGVGHLVTHIN